MDHHIEMPTQVSKAGERPPSPPKTGGEDHATTTFTDPSSTAGFPFPATPILPIPRNYGCVDLASLMLVNAKLANLKDDAIYSEEVALEFDTALPSRPSSPSPSPSPTLQLGGSTTTGTTSLGADIDIDTETIAMLLAGFNITRAPTNTPVFNSEGDEMECFPRHTWRKAFHTGEVLEGASLALDRYIAEENEEAAKIVAARRERKLAKQAAKKGKVGDDEDMYLYM